MSWIISNLIQLNENDAFGRHFAIILTFKNNNKIKPKSSLPGTARGRQEVLIKKSSLTLQQFHMKNCPSSSLRTVM